MRYLVLVTLTFMAGLILWPWVGELSGKLYKAVRDRKSGDEQK